MSSTESNPPDSAPVPELPWTGERLVPSAKGDFVAEHLHRYAVALEFAAGRDVLDIACGEGYGSALMAREARSVAGVDIDPATVAHASQRYRRENLLFKLGRAEEIPLPSGSIDLVVSFETLEHLDDHEAMLREVKRVLRPDGRLLISTPDAAPYHEVTGHLNPFHVHELSTEDFRQLLTRHFRHLTVAHQKTVVGSWIVPESSAPSSATEFHGDFSQIEKLPAEARSPYLIALASDAAIPLFSNSLFKGESELALVVKSLEAERDRERKQFAQLQAEFAERSAWAKSLESDLEKTRALFAKEAELVNERTHWARSLESDLEKTRARLAEESRLVEERTAWAKASDAEVTHNRSIIEHFSKELALADAASQRLHAENARLHHDLAAIQSACEILSSALPAVGVDAKTLLEKTALELLRIRHDLLTSEEQINAAKTQSLENEIQSAIGNATAQKLAATLGEAQIHVDQLLNHVRDLEKQSLDAKDLHARELHAAMIELNTTRLKLARYERVLLCRLAVRMLGGPGAPAAE